MVNTVKSNFRKIDVVARLGGDEFALLLPETDHEAAHNVLAKLRISLLEEMDKNKWSITFSFGVLTCTNSTQNTEELVKTADDLMYSAKRGGKNAIKYASYPSD